MTLADLASIGSLISGVAVLASLVYLAQQTRQNVRNSQAIIQQGRAARIADTALRLAELRADPGVDRCMIGMMDVSERDVGRFLNVCRAVFVSAEDSFFQHKSGLMDDLAFASFEASIRAGIGSSGLRAGWMLTREMYEREFRDYMDRLLNEARDVPGMQSRTLANWHLALEQVGSLPQPAPR
ncbi:MAG: hypothetical protein ACTHLR_11810 [Rhizomicrobium sp.]